MDITTVLGFFFQIREQIRTNEALRTALSTVWTAFTQAYAAFDEAYPSSASGNRPRNSRISTSSATRHSPPSCRPSRP